YLEQGPLYQSARVDDFYSAWNNNVISKSVKVYRCPSDATAGTGVLPGLDGSSQPLGVGSYAVNAQYICTVNSSTWELISPNGSAQLNVPDGTSNTLFVAEKLARCTNADYPE